MQKTNYQSPQERVLHENRQKTEVISRIKFVVHWKQATYKKAKINGVFSTGGKE